MNRDSRPLYLPQGRYLLVLLACLLFVLVAIPLGTHDAVATSALEVADGNPPPAEAAAEPTEETAEESDADAGSAAKQDEAKQAEESSEGSKGEDSAEQASDQKPQEEPPAEEETEQVSSSEEESNIEEDVTKSPPAEKDSKPEEQQPAPQEEQKTEQSVDSQGRKKHIIGATALILEKQSELLFHARVDSGAKSCSLHYEEIVIPDESKRMADNIGKMAQFKVKNHEDESVIEARIEGYVIIKTSDNKKKDYRYKVPLTLRWNGVEKTVLVTLNKRGRMDYPLLLGRNFLRGDFLIDVEKDSDD